MPSVPGKSVRESVELSVASELARRLPYFKKGSVLPYNGELTGEDGVDLIKRALNGRTPGLMVMTGAGAYRGEDTRAQRYMESLEVQFLVASTSYRSRLAQVHGDGVSHSTDDPGLYKVAEDVTRWMSGFDLEIDGIGPLKPGKQEVLYHGPSFCLWLLTFTTEVDRFFDRRNQAGLPLLEVDGWFNLVDGDEVLVIGGGIAPVRLLSAAAGVVTLVDPAAAFSSQLVGCQLEIAGANAYDNNGIYDIASVPTATSLTFAAPRGASENPYVGTYKIRMPKTARVAVVNGG
jgi:hypothetical protein